MCRWLTVLSSEPMSLSDVMITSPNSLIQLSKDGSFHPGYSNTNNHVTNGDGFGIGWYHTNYSYATMMIRPRPSLIHEHNDNHTNTAMMTTTTTMSHPTEIEDDDDRFTTTKKKHQQPHHHRRRRVQMKAAVFKDVQPAWNNSNLREICSSISSHCMVGHVRAASSFAGISLQNCHPYKAGRLLFCHNGRLEQFDMMRRTFHQQLSDEAFYHMKGTTDSEVILALLCTYLQQDSDSQLSPYEQMEPFGYERLTNAIKKVLRTIEHITIQCGLHDTTYHTCNFALTDGETMIVTRFCNKSPNIPPPSLYFAFGDYDDLYDELTNLDHETTTTTTTRTISSSSSSSVMSTPPSSPRHVNSMNSMATSSIGSASSSTTTSSSRHSTIPLSAIFDHGDNRSSIISHPPPVEVDHDHTNMRLISESGTYVTSDGSSSSSSLWEERLPVEHWESQPGTIYRDIDVQSATLIVASCPLTTRGHIWHPMPTNSILWYTRGTLPELRLLQKRHRHHPKHPSYIFSS